MNDKYVRFLMALVYLICHNISLSLAEAETSESFTVPIEVLTTMYEPGTLEHFVFGTMILHGIVRVQATDATSLGQLKSYVFNKRPFQEPHKMIDQLGRKGPTVAGINWELINERESEFLPQNHERYDDTLTLKDINYHERHARSGTWTEAIFGPPDNLKLVLAAKEPSA